MSNPTRANLTWSLVGLAGVGDDIVSALGAVWVVWDWEGERLGGMLGGIIECTLVGE